MPGPFGQPVSEWGQNGPVTWGDPMKYTEDAGGVWNVDGARCFWNSGGSDGGGKHINCWRGNNWNSC